MTEYVIFFHIKGGYYVAKITRKDKHRVDTGTQKVIIPFNGTNQTMKSYYIKDREFWGTFTGQAIHGYSKLITKEENPEYFI